METYGQIHTHGPWSIATHATHALCEDGKRRYAKVTGQPDTAFSIPARVVVWADGAAHSVSGYLITCETAGQPDVAFHACLYRRNAHYLDPQCTTFDVVLDTAWSGRQRVEQFFVQAHCAVAARMGTWEVNYWVFTAGARDHAHTGKLLITNCQRRPNPDEVSAAVKLDLQQYR